jgi:thioredoxin reductase (NADPH)
MPDPAIVLVDDDATRLAETVATVTDRYGSNYAIRCSGTAGDAAGCLQELAAAGSEVALVLVSLSLVTVATQELLDAVRHLHPQAKRAAVIGWSDTGDPDVGATILDAIGNGRLDHYVLQPKGSPDELFHHTVSGMLLDWTETARVSPHTGHVVGASWDGRAYDLRDTLGRCAMPHSFLLADSDDGRELVAQAGDGCDLPLVVFPDGTILRNPTDAEIAAASGSPVHPEDHDYDLVIVGGGPAGLSAAVYGASEGLTTLVVDGGGIGGQATSSSLIRNYLGFPPGISGRRLAQNAYTQAWVFGAHFVFMQRAVDVQRDDSTGQLAVVLAESGPIRTRAVLLAPGASWRRLDIPELEALSGAGVYYGGPTSEAPAMAGREVYLVGGANSAGQAALHLARFAERVTVLIRGDSLEAGMSDYLVRQVRTDSRIDVRLRTEVVGGGGAERLTHLVLRDRDSGGTEQVPADALFLLIGAQPHTTWLPETIARDPQGFVLTGTDLGDDSGWPLARPPLHLETSMPGVLAAGDARHASVKRVASAVGEGSVAIQLLHQLRAAECTPAPAG